MLKFKKMENKKTLVLGATTNPERYAYKAVHRLLESGHTVVPVGIKKGKVGGVEIVNNKNIFKDIHTITLYIGTKIQKEYYEYIINTQPKRVIFNPGTENEELYQLLDKNGIEKEVACTLVLLSIDNY